MSPRTNTTREAGSTLSLAMLALTIIALLMLYVGTQTMNSLMVGRSKQDRSVGMAAGDSAIEKYRVAVQSHLTDDFGAFQLTGADLVRLHNDSVAAGASVPVNLSSGQQDVGGVTVIRNQDALFGMAPAQVPSDAQYSVREPSGSNSYSWWQVYKVFPPRRNIKSTPGDLVVYFRAWATSRDANARVTTKPRLFRAEFRPTYLSDYQSVTDATFLVQDNPGFQIEGPIHSNGYEIQQDTFACSFICFAGWAGWGTDTHRGIYFSKAPKCGRGAQFSTSNDASIDVPGASCKNVSKRQDAREVSLLGVEDSYAYIAASCGAASMVICPTGNAQRTITLGYRSVSISGYGTFALRPTPGDPTGDTESLTILTNGEIALRGKLTMPSNIAGRVTIANRRTSTTQFIPRVRILPTHNGTVGAGDPTKDVVGVITQGDVVLEIPQANWAPCMKALNLAVVSESGSITIPTNFVTLAPPPVRLRGRRCDGATVFNGSYSSHGRFTSSMAWSSSDEDGKTATVGYSSPVLRYNDVFYVNTPPFFPTATPWAAVKAKEADQACLDPVNANDPTCE